MGKPDIPTFSTFECRSVLDSIQNEFDQLQKEDCSLSKLQQDLTDLIAQRNILTKRKGFNERYCVLCCSGFNLLFKRKLSCQNCNFLVCRSCSSWDYSSNQWLCKVCEKQKIFNAASRDWICKRLRTSFRNFSAAKALQNFCRNRRVSDSENDSGYGASAELPLMKLLSSHSLNKDLKMNDLSSHEGDCEEEEDEVGDEEELAEIHYSIETILEGLLGGTLDDALVDQLYPNSNIYLNLFSSYHLKLVEVIQNLSKALQKALHNLPSENGITPTTAHAALKNVITTLVEECQEIPPLQMEEPKEIDLNASLSFDFANIFSSYDSLVAAAVINKVVEESQSKFKQCDFTSMEENIKAELGNITPHSNFENGHEETESYINSETTAAPFDLPVECVQIEEIEEITQEFTDSDDDKLSSISKWSNSLQSIDEVGVQKHSGFDTFIDIDHSSQTPTPFPEFGCDLIDDPGNQEPGITRHPTVVTTWEENWLFRKKKRLPLYSNLKYQLLTYCDEPPCMLIPCPSESTDIVEQDEYSSELSETHSAGSLEFSSDPDDVSLEIENSSVKVSTPKEILSKSEKQMFSNSSPISVESKKVKESKMCQSKDKNSSENLSAARKNLTLSNVKTENQDLKKTEVVQEQSQSIKIDNNIDRNRSLPEGEIITETQYGTPPRPGTIAEREHKKWLNAVPLKNNPYSAENISKRSSLTKGILKEPISSFEEFERKLSISSETNEPTVKKVNCGPKSIDSELYKRDYYVNQDHRYRNDLYPLQKSAKYQYILNEDCIEPLSEEALNSFEEKIYVRSGKVFTIENHVKRLEQEIKDPPLSPDLSRETRYVPRNVKQVNSQYVNGTSVKPVVATYNDATSGHVFNNSSATKFGPNSLQELSGNKQSIVLNNIEQEKAKKTKPCRKIHSLTARSLSREFRDLAKLNLPKPMNRTIQVPSQNSEEGERESLCSPESIQSSFSTGHPDNTHGYTSDESNTSTNSVTKNKSRRHISRSILERATYWERRAEQGLLSDASVSEEFPGIDINPD
ncbi:rab effector MyRIP [Trichonephila inaurata madagascariensis]|uniref:Rab effector MyRIP n=1 Tax=Trichonephila inaurata madagascariensis TaxID=2747483 RepID=A0A8X6X3C9_9ARAC|nr:rab effector MyRIP [Trichonephila inaurata madagascariensis]